MEQASPVPKVRRFALVTDVGAGCGGRGGYPAFPAPSVFEGPGRCTTRADHAV